MRAAAGLAPQSFTDPSLTGVAIKAAHVTQLRTALDAARTTIGLPALSYTDSTITVAKRHTSSICATASSNLGGGRETHPPPPSHVYRVMRSWYAMAFSDWRVHPGRFLLS
jgi:hypothetical protein